MCRTVWTVEELNFTSPGMGNLPTDGPVQITTKEIREMEERWNALAMTSETPAIMDDITEVILFTQ